MTGKLSENYLMARRGEDSEPIFIANEEVEVYTTFMNRKGTSYELPIGWKGVVERQSSHEFLEGKGFKELPLEWVVRLGLKLMNE